MKVLPWKMMWHSSRELISSNETKEKLEKVFLKVDKLEPS